MLQMDLENMNGKAQNKCSKLQ